MFKHRSVSKLLVALLVVAGACAQTATAPPGLTLTQAIDQALKHNLQATLAQERTVEARAQRGIGLSALLPNVSGVAYQMNLTENLAAQGLTASIFPGIPAFIGPFNRFDARFEMVESLFNLPAIRRYQATRYGVQLAEQQRRLAEQQVTTATTLAYIGVLETGQSVAAAESNVQLSRQLLDLAVNQRKAGIATGLDVARAETRLASQQVQLAQAQTNLDTARLNLLRVIGSPLSAEFSPADAMRFEPQPAPEAGAAIRQALGERLELSVASAGLRIAEAERKAAIGGWAPSVSAFGDYGSSGLKPNEVDLPTRSVGIRVDVPIFNGGRTRSEVQAATSRVRQAEMQLSDLRAAVEKDVRQALDNLATREEQMRAAQKNLELAQRELSLAQDRFRNGVADNIEVTAAQTELENARQIAVSSLAQFNIARLNLFSAMGRARDFTF
ncbi:MAG: TolC family protein [Bryobacteraceae bacterium]|jgi:outer membrane protein TolC